MQSKKCIKYLNWNIIVTKVPWTSQKNTLLRWLCVRFNIQNLCNIVTSQKFKFEQWNYLNKGKLAPKRVNYKESDWIMSNFVIYFLEFDLSYLDVQARLCKFKRFSRIFVNIIISTVSSFWGIWISIWNQLFPQQYSEGSRDSTDLPACTFPFKPSSCLSDQSVSFRGLFRHKWQDQVHHRHVWPQPCPPPWLAGTYSDIVLH